MKYLVGFCRVFVGILFIISGLIKLNDPLGFSFKLEEYFSQGVLDLPIFIPYALSIAIIVVIIEVLLGVMLLLGFWPKTTVWSLLGMIVFFTFLTWYSAYYNKVTDCGCFGDAIKLTPWESFTKDIVLLVLILVLVIGIRYIKPFLNNNTTRALAATSMVGCVIFCYYVLNHLPAKDFRPYKIGANIQEGMEIPENAPEAVYDYAWKFKVNGEEKIITTSGDYPTVENGEFVDVETTLVQEGYEPPVHDFTIERDGEDFTTQMLNEPKLVMVIAYDLAKSDLQAFLSVRKVTDEAILKGYKVIGMSASGDEIGSTIKKEYKLNFDFYFTDETTLKTIVRSNPGILVLNRGTIKQKVHYNDIGELVFEEPVSGIYFDLKLKKELDSIFVLDQKYRGGESLMENWNLQEEIDSSNIRFVEGVFKEKGYPGISMVGKETSEAAWYVLQHSNKIEDYIHVIKEAADGGELDPRKYAMMLDRYLMQKGEPQIYGTQGSAYFIGTPRQKAFVWPLKNVDSVNILRKQVGFELTVEENGKRLFGEDFEFKNYSIKEIENLKKRGY